MAKKPKDAPQIGDRVEWRGHGNIGILEQVDSTNDWATVRWQQGVGPVLIHLFELKKLS
jgi:hypothetical protein